MRQIQVQVPAGLGETAAARATDLGAVTLSWWSARGGDGRDVDILSVAVPNASVGELLLELGELGTIEASLPSSGALAFEPPSAEPPDELIDVSPRSPIEILLAGQQSAGSWGGFVTYAITAGVVVWIGLYTETIYLLTASMLLAPFAGPAMNTAIAIASGDRGLLKHSLYRYVVGISITAVACGVLTLLVGQHRVSDLTADVMSISSVAVLLPLAAGIAGANHLVQSEHSSLVSGAAVGMLVAASLAPPTGGVGIAVALGRWDLVGTGLFVVALQLVGITLTATIVFRLFDLSPERGRFEKTRDLLPAAMTALALVAGGLLLYQFVTTTALQSSSLAQTATEIATDVVRADDRVILLEVTANSPSEEVPGPLRVLVSVDVEVVPAADVGDLAALEQDLASAIRDAVDDRVAEVGAAVDVTAYPARDDTTVPSS